MYGMGAGLHSLALGTSVHEAVSSYAGPRVVNPLIGGLASASSRHSGFIGLHSIGA